MKKCKYHLITMLMVTFFVPSILYAAGNSLTVEFTTASYNGRFSPRHCLAVWVTDENGDFVKTLQINGRYPEYRNMLAQWIMDSDWDSTDAVTSASLRQHKSHSIVWDLTDLSGEQISDGAYTVWVELTEDNSKFPGIVPLAELNFTMGKSFTQEYTDVVHKGHTSISNISMNLAVEGSPVLHNTTLKSSENAIELCNNNLKVAEGPMGEEWRVSVMNAKGQVVSSGDTEKSVFSVENLPSGVYFVQMVQGQKSCFRSFTK